MAKSYLSPFSWIEDLFGEGFIFAITLSGSSLVYEEGSFLRMYTANSWPYKINAQLIKTRKKYVFQLQNILCVMSCLADCKDLSLYIRLDPMISQIQDKAVPFLLIGKCNYRHLIIFNTRIIMYISRAAILSKKILNQLVKTVMLLKIIVNLAC